ncbi:DDE superfamily endonuclease [Streptomyces sp. TLI_185]|nr:DDE superfamily endonuclease [Streptomyces sp. TLI_185]
MLVHPSSIDLSNRTLRFLTGQLTVRCEEIGTRWRRLSAARQALLALACLRCADTYAQLAAGFGIGIATVYRYIREAVEVLSTLAPSLAEAMRAIRAKAFVILDGTLLPIDRVAADTPYYSGKHKRHGMNARSSRIRSDGCSGPRPRCPAPRTTSPPHDNTGSSKPSPMRGSDAGPIGRIKAPATLSGCRFEAALSSDGSAATTPPTPRSAVSASRRWPPSRAGASCGNSAAAPTASPTS